MKNNHISEKVLEQVRSAGLDEKQALIYVSALQTGGGTITDLAKASGVERTGLYYHLDGLVKRGLLKPSTTRKRTVYLPSSPERLMELVRDKEKELEQAIPLLQSMAAEVTGESQVVYYQGREGIRNLYEDYVRLLKLQPEGSRRLVMTRNFSNMKAFPDFFPGFISRIASLPISSKVILPESEKPPKKLKENADTIAKYTLHASDRKYVPDKYFPPSTVMIFGDYVGTVDIENFFGSITKSPGLAKTWENVFEFMWDHLPTPPK